MRSSPKDISKDIKINNKFMKWFFDNWEPSDEHLSVFFRIAAGDYEATPVPEVMFNGHLPAVLVYDPDRRVVDDYKDQLSNGTPNSTEKNPWESDPFLPVARYDLDAGLIRFASKENVQTHAAELLKLKPDRFYMLYADGYDPIRRYGSGYDEEFSKVLAAVGEIPENEMLRKLWRLNTIPTLKRPSAIFKTILEETYFEAYYLSRDRRTLTIPKMGNNLDYSLGLARIAYPVIQEFSSFANLPEMIEYMRMYQNYDPDTNHVATVAKSGHLSRKNKELLRKWCLKEAANAKERHSNFLCYDDEESVELAESAYKGRSRLVQSARILGVGRHSVPSP